MDAIHDSYIKMKLAKHAQSILGLLNRYFKIINNRQLININLFIYLKSMFLT